MRTIARTSCRLVAGMIVALLATSVSLAQEQQQPPQPTEDKSWRGFYLGAGGNYSTVSVERPNSDDCDDGCYPYWGGWPTSEEGDGDYGYNVHAGLRLHRYFAIEAAYMETGTIGWDESLVYIAELNDYYNNHVSLDVQAAELSVVGIWPFLERWEIYLGVGAAWWEGQTEQFLDQSFGDAVVSREEQEDGVEWLFRLGLGYTFADAFHVRLEASGFDIGREVLNTRDSTSVDTIVLDVQYRFGAH
jgi:opacity protein-like surface antigen